MRDDSRLLGQPKDQLPVKLMHCKHLKYREPPPTSVVVQYPFLCLKLKLEFPVKMNEGHDQ
jgi:hypothetical protein